MGLDGWVSGWDMMGGWDREGKRGCDEMAVIHC